MTRPGIFRGNGIDIAAVLSSGTAMWLLAGVWHKVVMARFYAAETHASHQGVGIIFAAYIVLAALMAYLFPRGKEGRCSAGEGFKFGVIIGVLWVFPHELAMAGAHGKPVAYAFKNAAWHALEQGLGGLVLAWVYGRKAAGSAMSA